MGNLVYTVDESGQLLDYLKSQGSEEVRLTDEDLAELRTQIVDYAAGFDREDFYTVYDFRGSLSGTVQKLSNSSVLNNIRSLNSDSATLSSINYCYARDTGIVVYSVDGYEDTTLRSMTKEKLDSSLYDKKQLVGNSLVARGDTVYKLCTEESWSVVILENDTDKVERLKDMRYVKVRFLKNQDESWGKVDSFTNDEGDTFVELSFTNSMVTFCRDRFLSIELITEEERGLKIPNSAIAEKSFYIVPKEYVITGNSGARGVMRERYDENGSLSTEFVETAIYNEADEGYYVDETVLRAGDILVLADSGSRYTVSRQDSLIGVYNINKGYADFRQIRILYQNDEYAIVRPNTTYGLSVYDFIVLDASTVEDGTTG